MKSLRMRIMSFLVPIVIVALTIIIVIVLMNVTNMVEEQSIAYEQSIAADHAAEIEVELDKVAASLDALAGAFESIKEDGLTDRRISDDMMKGVLERNEMLIGVWTVWEADAYDGKDSEYAGKVGSDETGRYIPYWYRDGGQIALDTLVDYDTEGLGDWNLIARKTGEATIMDPFYYEVGGVDVLMTTIAVPIEVDGSVIGAVGADIALTDLQNLIEHIKIYESGYGVILSNNSIFVAHPKTDLVTQFIGDYIKDQTIIDRIAAGEAFFDIQVSSVTGEASHYTYAPIYIGRTTTPWTFVTVTKEDEVFAETHNLILLTVIICVIGVSIFILALWYVISRIVKPITMTSKVIAQFAEYDFADSNISLDAYLGLKDEIGIMANAVNTLKVNTVELMSEISDSAAQVSASSQQLMATSQEAALSVGEVGTTVEEIARGAADQAEDTGRGVEGVHELGVLIDRDQGLVRALNELTDHVTHLKDEGTEILTDLVEKTQATAASTGEVKEVIENTNKSAEQIENASQMIQSIADQTNLLALNAAIEAARAGEAGKGFAVVADEIRKLAEESNKFTQEIASIIDALGSQTQKAVTTMDEVNVTVTNQADSVQATNEKFAGIADALGEMKTSIDGIMASSTEMTDKKDSISDVMSNLSAISEENAASSEEALASVEEQTAAMDEIAEASKSLSSLAEGMQDSVAKFKY